MIRIVYGFVTVVKLKRCKWKWYRKDSKSWLLSDKHSTTMFFEETNTALHQKKICGICIFSEWTQHWVCLNVKQPNRKFWYGFLQIKPKTVHNLLYGAIFISGSRQHISTRLATVPRNGTGDSRQKEIKDNWEKRNCCWKGKQFGLRGEFYVRDFTWAYKPTWA